MKLSVEQCIEALSPRSPYEREVARTPVFLTELATQLRWEPSSYCAEEAKGRRIDAWQIQCQAHKRFEVTAFEIKVSRSDFRADAKNRHKQRHAKRLSNRFYYVIPEGLFTDPEAEVPDDCGLIEVSIVEGRPVPQRVVVAPYRDICPPTWEFVAAVARRAYKEGEELCKPPS